MLVPEASVSTLNTPSPQGDSHVTSPSKERTLWMCAHGFVHDHPLTSQFHFLAGHALCFLGFLRWQCTTQALVPHFPGDRPGISLVQFNKHWTGALCGPRGVRCVGRAKREAKLWFLRDHMRRTEVKILPLEIQRPFVSGTLLWG